jgi:4-hydroxybenzoate polyprenyltransferase
MSARFTQPRLACYHHTSQDVSRAALPDTPPDLRMSGSLQPIVVDLDGTLSRSDTLHDQLIRAALRHPLRLIKALPQAYRSRAAFKASLAQIPLPGRAHPAWNAQVLAYLQRCTEGRKVLCTASNREAAFHLVRPLELFAEVHGSDAGTNLRGEAKASLLRTLYGRGGFTYVGNDATDLPVWKEAARAVVVSDDNGFVKQVEKLCPDVEQLAPQRPAVVRSIWKALRPHQWAKNLLLFVPVLTSHRFTEYPLLLEAFQAFLVFCLLSSSVYLLNDAIDLDADRQHATKRLRPFASGDLSVLWAPLLALVFSTAGLTLAFAASVRFGLACCTYVVLSVLYSSFVKKVAILDVFVLAGLYTLRLLAGGAITGIPISIWLAAFSISIFLSLALCKRYVELLDLPKNSDARIVRRGYGAGDTRYVLAQGLAAMGCAGLILAVYLNSSTVTLLYRSPSLLWGVVAVVSFWGARLWLLASRRQLHDDPVLFALRDPISWCCLGVLLAVFFAAMLIA